MEQPRDNKGRFTSMDRKNVLIHKGNGDNSEDLLSSRIKEMQLPEDIDLKVNLNQVTESYFQNRMEDKFDTIICQARAVEIKGIYFDGYGTVFGGPYSLRPKGLKGMKLAPEVAGDYDHMLCVKDFGIPSVKEMDLAILIGIKYLQEFGAFYVGCMMGQGRTGTYLACLLKVFRYQKPIDEVRYLYNKNAVETEQQEKFIENYPVDKFEYLVRFLAKNQ